MNWKQISIWATATLLITAFMPLYPASASSAGWSKTYHDFPLYLGTVSLAQASNGGHVLAGTSYNERGDRVVLLIKTDVAGYLEWNRTYGSEDSGVNSMIKTTDGGYALAGWTWNGAYSEDFWLVKTDADGNILWNQTYQGSPKNDYANIVIQTNDGGYALAGFLNDSGYWFIKTDFEGNALYNKTKVVTPTLIQNSEGDYMVATGTSLFAFDQYFNLLWVQDYGVAASNGGLSVTSLIQTADGGYAFLGWEQYHRAGGAWWLLKTYPNGTLEWERNPPGGLQIIQTSDCGYAYASGSYLIKLDSQGATLWSQPLPGNPDEYFIVHDISQTSDGGYVLGGAQGPLGATKYFWLVKTDAEGTTNTAAPITSVTIVATPSPAPSSLAIQTPSLSPIFSPTPSPSIPEFPYATLMVLVATASAIAVLLSKKRLRQEPFQLR